MLKIIKIIIIAALAAGTLAYYRRKITTIRTFQWLAKIILAVTVILILGMIIGIF